MSNALKRRGGWRRAFVDGKWVNRRTRHRYVPTRDDFDLRPTDVPDWAARAKFDWSMNNSVIARLVGVSRSAVWKARRDCGAPEPRETTTRPGTYGEKILWIRDEAESMTVGQIADAVGCSIGRARFVIKRLGIKHAEALRATKIKFPDWTDVEEWALSNVEMARKYGTTPGYVALYRHRKKIPCSTRLKAILAKRVSSV